MNAIFARFFNKSFIVTIARYALAAAGAWLVTKGFIDEGTWEIVGGAILTIVMALLGGAEAVKDKAVVDGKAVAVEKLPVSVQASLEAAVSVTKARSIWAILTGK